jgi:hypothetical protein
LVRELAAAVVPDGDLDTAGRLVQTSLALLSREGYAEIRDSAI